jgi:hypothetical protein
MRHLLQRRLHEEGGAIVGCTPRTLSGYNIFGIEHYMTEASTPSNEN